MGPRRLPRPPVRWFWLQVATAAESISLSWTVLHEGLRS